LLKQFAVINPNFNGSSNQNTKCRIVFKKDYNTNYAFDSTSSIKTIIKGNNSTFSFYFTPSTEGTYYYVPGTSSLANGSYLNTDGWAWNEEYKINVVQGKSVEILSFEVPTGEMQRDQNTNVKVKIKNIGSTRRTFWVGLSFAEDWVDLEETPGPWPDGWYDIRPKESKLLNPEESTIVEFDFNIPSTLPSGTHRARTAIWNGYNSSLHKMLEPRFEKLDKTSFRLGNYPNPISLLATQFLDITSKILFDDTPFENMSSRYYENDNGYREKVLLYIKISANAQLLGLPVEVGGAILIDLADLFDITNEGKDQGWVSVWIDGEAGVSVSANSFEIDMGLAYHKFDYGEIALADYRKKIIAEASGQAGFIVFSGLGWNEGLQYPRIKIVSNFDIGVEATATLQELYSVEINKQYFLNALMQAGGGNLSELGNSIINYLINNEDNGFIRDKTEDDGNYWIENKEGDWSFDLKCSRPGYSNYFYTNIANEASELKIIAAYGIGDADLYVKYGSRPKLNDYDYISSNLNTNNELVVIENPDLGDWYFMLYAKLDYSGVNLSVKSQDVTTFTVITSSNPSNGGSTSDDSTYDKENQVTVCATPNDGWRFINWTENDTLVSDSSCYSFIINSDRDLVANFQLLQSVILTTPNGGESWITGTTQNITWIAENVDNIKIEYSTDNGSSWISIINSYAASIESYPWTIPNTPSNQCLVRVSEIYGYSSDVSDAAFTISTIPPVPSLVSPINGSTITDRTPTFDWNNSSGASGYDIQIDNNSPAAATPSNYTPGTDLSIGDHTWKVRAKNAAGESIWAIAWNFTIVLTPPEQPSDLVIDEIQLRNITLIWNDNSDNEFVFN